MELLPALIRSLRQALAADGGRDAPVTVGDVYQRLIPYRTARDELGILEFAAYEHGLLRLLAGEGGHVALHDPQALEEIQRELASTNPILGIYRDYSEARVDITEGGQADPGDVARASAPSAAPVAGPPPIARLEPETAADLPTHPADPPAAPASPERPDERPSSPSASSTCRRCEQPLPQIDALLFCPFCGESQGPQPCAACGTPLEGAWSFCIRCGTERD